MRDLAASPAAVARVLRTLRQRASQTATIGLVLVTGGAVFSQPDFDVAAYEERQRQSVDRIRAVQAQDGNSAVGLIAPLTELALLYEEGDDHVLAIAAIERALDVVRSNLGLYSLEQAPLLRQAIRNEEALQDPEAAWDREQQLLQLAMRHPDDLRTVAIFREIADRRMDLFDAWNAGEYPGQMILGGYCLPLGQIFTCDRKKAALQVVGDAQTYYADAIEVILRNELYSSEELRALEMKLVRTSDLVRLRPELDARGPVRIHGIDEEDRYTVATLVGSNPNITRLVRLGPRHATEGEEASEEQPPVPGGAVSYYTFGRHSLARLYDYEVASAAPLLNQLEAVVRIADWDLLYSRNSLAIDGYEQVVAFLEQAPGTEPWSEEFFSPAVPVVLPAFEPNPFASERTSDSNGYIDVAFRITKYGEPRRIRILDTTDAADSAQERLVRLIRSSRFRPRIADGELDASSVVVRHYVEASDELSGH